jgi:hypothetical protein
MKFKTLFRTLVALMVATALCSGGLAYAEDDPHGWEFELTPYAWMKSVKGTSGDADIDLDFFDDIVEILEGAFMISFNARKGLFSTFAAFEYNEVADSARLNQTLDYEVPGTGITVPIDARTKVGFSEEQYGAEIGIGYDVYSTQSTVWDLIGGVKWYKNDTTLELRDIKLEGPGGIELPSVKGNKIREGDDWWHPFVGFRFAANMGEHWRLRGRGDWGREDSDNESWTLQAMIDYRFNSWGAVEFGYRHREIDYDNGSSSHPYVYDAKERGPILGFIFHF